MNSYKLMTWEELTETHIQALRTRRKITLIIKICEELIQYRTPDSDLERLKRLAEQDAKIYQISAEFSRRADLLHDEFLKLLN
jgi:hypothetical protein